MKIKVSWALPILIVIHVLVWFVSFKVLASNDIYGLYPSYASFIIDNQGEFYSTLLMFMLSFNILLSARLRFFENIFSGLDKVYVVHKYTGYFTILLLILHNALIEGFSFVSGFFTFARDIANPLLYAFLIAIFISALPNIPYINKILKIPYHIWKYTHYLMGFLFVIGIYHSLGVSTLTFSNPILSTYMYIAYIVGSVAFIYKTFLYKFLKKRYEYTISNINAFNDIQTLEITLDADKEEAKSFGNKAGQFAFFTFQEEGAEETHPFTISNSINEEKKLRLSIKALGDWTSILKDKIKVGTKVLVEGPYGKFISNKDSNATEVWIAGGIGITPFLAMLQDYKKNNNINKKIIFVWSVKNESEAIYKNEIEENLPSNIQFILHDTTKMGFFKFESLLSKTNDKKNTSIYICGPAPMREAIINDAKKENFSDFHFEEFSFR